MRLLLWLVFPMLVSFAGALPAKSEEYRLGPEDQVRLKVYEWRATRDEVFEWRALNDVFFVGANGMLPLPLIGEVPAKGLTPDELAKSVSDRLRAKMALGRTPETSVEVVQFRPFYIVGQVDRPGQYPYRPALTVLKALSIAGGLQRVTDPASARLGREIISARGDLNVLRTQAYSLIARKARLQAELDRSETVSFPNELTQQAGDASIALITQQEKSIFKAHQDAFTTQMRALAQLKSHLEQEIVSLNGQLEKEDTQIKLVKMELDNISSLVGKGLASAPRQLSLERLLAQIEGERLRVGTALLKVRQEISRTDISMLELHNKRGDSASSQLRETQAKLDEVMRKIATTEDLIFETGAFATQALSRRELVHKAQPIYTIVRQPGEQTIEFKATETTRVMPGDTIKVDVPVILDSSPATGLYSGRPAEVR